MTTTKKLREQLGTDPLTQANQRAKQYKNRYDNGMEVSKTTPAMRTLAAATVKSAPNSPKGESSEESFSIPNSPFVAGIYEEPTPETVVCDA